MLFEDDKEVHFMKYSIKGTSFFKYKMIATLIFNFSMKSFAWGWQVFVNLTTNKRNFAKRIWHFPLLFRELNIRNGRGQILENENLHKKANGSNWNAWKAIFLFFIITILIIFFFFSASVAIGYSILVNVPTYMFSNYIIYLVTWLRNLSPDLVDVLWIPKLNIETARKSHLAATWVSFLLSWTFPLFWAGERC